MQDIQKLINERKKKEQNRPKALTKVELEEQVTDWCDFYRKNWDMYARYELGITALHSFQEYILYELGISNVFFLMCGRGLSKSFLASLGSFITCMLYPHSEIVLTATTIKTAKKMVKNKMEGELCGSFSPKLKYLYEQKQIVFRYADDEIIISFLFNDSWIKVLPENENSAGERSTFLMFEEVRMSKQNIINRIFMPMRHARRAEYILKDEYKNDKRLVEKAKVIYLTSTSYTFEWFFDRWRAVVGGYFNSKSKIRYGIFAGDILTSIYHNFTTQEEFDAVKDDPSYSQEEILMEYYNEPQGGIGDAFYSMEKIKENSIIKEGFVPPTYEEFIINCESDRNNIFREKTENEKRVIYVDFASSDTVKKGQENDYTVIGCMSGAFDIKRKRVIRNLDYMETMSGGKVEESIKRIRELFYFYQADVFIYDNQQVGSERFLELTKSYEHPELGTHMNGFGIYSDVMITNKFCDNSKTEDWKTKIIDKNAIPVAIPVVGSGERNQNFHVAMQNAINKKYIYFLMDSTKLRFELDNDEKWFLKDAEEKKRRMIGHHQTDGMAIEASELKKTIKSGYIALEEIPHHPKDRIMSTAYGNYFFNLLEQKILKEEQEPDNEDISAWSFLAKL
ncbi:MAG: hypothetical protein BV457_07815 [Thermoplasmata archaeon M9B1D]|nr:MAG: hypothetical protein BV457_07815 [Thermoplasmata archaeon M9B1D]